MAVAVSWCSVLLIIWVDCDTLSISIMTYQSWKQNLALTVWNHRKDFEKHWGQIVFSEGVKIPDELMEEALRKNPKERIPESKKVAEVQLYTIILDCQGMPFPDYAELLKAVPFPLYRVDLNEKANKVFIAVQDRATVDDIINMQGISVRGVHYGVMESWGNHNPNTSVFLTGIADWAPHIILKKRLTRNPAQVIGIRPDAVAVFAQAGNADLPLNSSRARVCWFYMSLSLDARVADSQSRVFQKEPKMAQGTDKM